MGRDSPTLHTFDWSLTERRIVMLVPNFGRGHLFRAALHHFRTQLAAEDYLILIANDGIEEDFSDLAPQSVAYFTLRRSDPSPRNGAKLRNAVIKRCRSEWLFQRDPEILLEGDVLARCLDSHAQTHRVGQVALLDRATSDVLHGIAMNARHASTIAQREGAGESIPAASSNSATLAAHPCTSPPLLSTLSWRKIDPNASTFLHFGFGARTSLLQSIRGYDEAFTHYGYEDVDLFERLRTLGELPQPDFDTHAAHLWHEPLPVGAGSVKDDAIAMRQIYLDHKSLGPVRNPHNWGEG